METYLGEVEILHPKFAPDSNAVPVHLEEDPSGNVSDIVYSLNTTKQSTIGRGSK